MLGQQAVEAQLLGGGSGGPGVGFVGRIPAEAVQPAVAAQVTERRRERSRQGVPVGSRQPSGRSLGPQHHRGRAGQRAELQRRDRTVLAQHPGAQVEAAAQQGRVAHGTGQRRPVRAPGQLAVGAGTGIDAGRPHAGIGGRVGEQRSAAGTEPAVRDREQRLVHPLQIRVEPVDGQRPVGGVVDVGYVAAAPPFQLVGQQREEPGRPAAEHGHPGRDAGRLRPDRHRHRPAGLRYQQRRVGTGYPADPAERGTGEQHQARRDTAAA